MRRKMGGLGDYKNSFFGGSKKCDFAKVSNPAGALVESGVGGAFFGKKENVVKRTVRYQFRNIF